MNADEQRLVERALRVQARLLDKLGRSDEAELVRARVPNEQVPIRKIRVSGARVLASLELGKTAARRQGSKVGRSFSDSVDLVLEAQDSERVVINVKGVAFQAIDDVAGQISAVTSPAKRGQRDH